MPTTFQSEDPEIQLVGPAQAGRKPRYRLPVSEYFLLVHSPLSWELVETDDGDRWIPKLSRLILKPGCNGVRSGVKDGPPDATIALVQLAQRGLTVIPEEFDGGYVIRVPVVGGWAHMLKFDRPVRLGRDAVVRHDEKGYRDFRIKLLEDGVLAPPQQEALDKLISIQRSRASRNAARQHVAQIKQNTDAAVTKLDRMRKAANG